MVSLLWRFVPFVMAAGLIGALWHVPDVPAAEVRYLRIAAEPAGTPGFDGATALAVVLTRPPGLPPCPAGEACGIPGLVALAQSLDAPGDIVRAVASGAVELGVAPADAVFDGTCPLPGATARRVTVVAELFDEALHVLVRVGAGISTPSDLKGKRVAIGTLNSLDRRLADRVLTAYGLRRKDIRIVELGGAAALTALAAGKVDAAFRIAAWPDRAIKAALDGKAAELLPIEGEGAGGLAASAPFREAGRIPAAAYGTATDVATLLQPALLIATPSLSTDRVAPLGRALASPANLQALRHDRSELPFVAQPMATGRWPAPSHPGLAGLRRETPPLECPDVRR